MEQVIGQKMEKIRTVPTAKQRVSNVVNVIQQIY